jgi:hypothetical protein
VVRVSRLARGASLAAVSPGDGWLLARMLAWRTVLPLLKRHVSLATLARVMWQDPRSPTRQDRADRIPELVERVYRGLRAGPEGSCLERSLLTYRFLSAAGAEPRLVIGIRGPGGSVVGHAWVVVDGEALFEPTAPTGEYASFFSFGRDGRIDTSTADGVPTR